MRMLQSEILSSLYRVIYQGSQSLRNMPGISKCSSKLFTYGSDPYCLIQKRLSSDLKAPIEVMEMCWLLPQTSSGFAGQWSPLPRRARCPQSWQRPVECPPLVCSGPGTGQTEKVLWSRCAWPEVFFPEGNTNLISVVFNIDDFPLLWSFINSFVLL